MDEKTGWIKLNRKILKWRWYKDLNTKALFLHLLLNANIDDHDFEDITVHRGQLVTSYPHLAYETGLSVRQVRTALGHLKSTGEVTVSSCSKYSVISIPNYDSYQQARQAKRQASDRRATGDRQQLKNNKNNKNEKKEDMPSAVPEIREWERGIPEQFVGRFPNEAAWKKFWGIEDDEP